MKRYIKSLLQLTCSLLLVSEGFAQQQSNPAGNIPLTIPAGTQQPGISYPDLSNMGGNLPVNFVRTELPDKPLDNIPANANTYIRQSTGYFDGLGRPLQEVAKKAHADGYDMVQPHVYDQTGKERYMYQPAAIPLNYSNGTMSKPISTRMHQFYDNLGPDEQPYSKTETDNSPLNRVTKQLAPGKSWVGSNRAKVFEYRGNIVAEVRNWSIGVASWALPVSSSSYNPSEISVTKVTDEDEKYRIEYKDKSGKLIMTKGMGYDDHQAETDHNGNACTYYVYDDLQRLRFVIPPEAVAQRTTSGNTWSIGQDVANGLCYQYSYDGRGRMTEKKIPGKAAEYYVYDKRDRQVLYQDGNMRGDWDWSFTLYDVLDRPVCQGTYHTDAPESRVGMQSLMDNGVNYAAPDLFYYLKQYDLYHVYPSIVGGGKVLGYTYYDDYGQLQNFGYNSNQFDNITLPSEGTVVPSTLSTHTRGLITGSKIRVMDPDAPGIDTWLTMANYYDDKGRLIQAQSQNYKGGLDISSNIYYFQGMLWKNIQFHQNPSAEAIATVTDGALTSIFVVKTFERNLALGGGSDQVYKVTQKIGNGITYDLAYYDYDHLGRVTVKQFPAAEVLQEYNMRGWLKHIQVANFNNDPLTSSLDPHIFDEKLYYDTGFATKLYNGNIAGITWKKAGSHAPIEAYGYSYDWLNRLTHAEYRQTPYNSTNWMKNQYDYTVSNIAYDLNGNIQSLDQEAPDMQPNTLPMHMDQLTYSYETNSNRLLKVTDGVPASSTGLLPDFKDNANLSQEYGYDPNGNITGDQNKGITGIVYSLLNKPEKITVDGEGTITYIYDAAGNRLQKKVLNTNTNIEEVYDYIGNFVYKNNVLQYILNEEGRTRPVPVALANTNNSQFTTKFVYDYFVKDHLGNVRSTVTAEPMDGVYLARHEIASANIEQLLFDNIPDVRDNKPGSTAINDGMAARLDGGDANRRIGTAIMLRAMPGDRFNISTDAYYEGEYTQSDEAHAEDVISSLMGALTGGSTYSGVPLSELPDNIRTITGALNNPALASQLDNLINSNNNPNAPKAHLNYLFFNDKLELIPGGSGSVQVPVNPMGWININPGSATGSASSVINGGYVTTVEPGYLVVYIDNQSIGKEVWFDNVTIGHYKGVVTEENHYYPFGLTLNTAQAPNVTDQPYKYNGNELDKSFGLEMYDYHARQYDPQIGRMPSPDPMASKFMSFSPYNYALNNPANMIDPDGRSATFTFDKESSTLTISAKVYYKGKDLPKTAEDRKTLMDKVNSDLKSTYKDGTGTSGDNTWTVKFDITAEINENVKEGDLKDGENIMTLDNNAPQLVEANGSLRQKVMGGKSNMGYLMHKGGTNVDVHEIGHMLGFMDRYTDYGSADRKSSRSIFHSGYNGDLMGANVLNFSQSHYNDAVQYTNYKLTTGQSNLLPQFRSNSFSVNGNFDQFTPSATSPDDIPPGWIKR